MYDLVEAGLSWLFDGADKHPQGILTHHGIFAGKEAVFLQIIPSGVQFYPVLVIDKRSAEAFPKEYIADLTEMINYLGYSLERTIVSDSRLHLVLHKLAHPRVLNFVDNYYRGCPTHKSVFCESRPLGSCDWFSRGNNLVKYPVGWH